jgi:KEOPS complex subunit Cgi121
MIEIIGAKTAKRALHTSSIIEYTQELSKKHNNMIQVFDANFIYGSEHISSALDHAKRAFENNKATATTLGMEILLYASGEYQIKNAIAKLGIKENTDQIAVLIYDENNKIKKELDDLINNILQEIKFTRDDDVLLGDISTLESFGISKEELSAVPEDKWLDLVLEKVALVDIIK